MIAMTHAGYVAAGWIGTFALIGGFGAFTVVAETHESFGRALTKKLIAEIAGLPQPQLAAAGPE